MDTSTGISLPLTLNILFFKILCCWPIETRNHIFNNFQKTLGRVSLIAFTLFMISLNYRIASANDMKIRTALFPVALVYAMGLAKAIFIMRHYKSIFALIKQAGLVETRVLAYNVADLTLLVHNNHQFTFRIILSYGATIFSLAVVYAIQPWVENAIFSESVDENEKTSIFDVWVPWDKTSNLNYSLTYIYELMMLFLGSAQNVAYDTLILALFMHIITELRILNYNLRNLTKNGYLPMDKLIVKSGSEKYKLRLIYIFKEIQEVTGFVDTLDRLIKGIVFLYFSVAGLTLCCTIYQVSLPDISLLLLVKMGGFTIALLMQLFTLFWFGNQVTIESEQLLVASYDCGWYSADLHFQKHFMLLRNSFLRQYAFNIGSFSKISLKTFLVVLKTTYSVFTIMRQTQPTGRDNQDIVIL